MDWIDAQVKGAFQSVPRRGAETGGLLVGSKTTKDGHPLVIVESAEAIECEHREGPRFILSEMDRAKLVAQMNRLRAEGLVVAGFFRSHTRDEIPVSELTLNRDDKELLEMWCGAGSSVFLLLRPFSMSRVGGNLFFGHAGRVSQDSGFMPFPFTAHEPTPLRQALPPSAPVAARGRRLTWVWLVVFALAGAATGYRIISVFAGSRTRARTERAVPFDLAADRVQNKLVLRWDPAAPGLRDAQAAGLVIRDGATTTRLNLDRARLLQGTLTYQPQDGDVTFSLETNNAAGRDGRGVLTVIEPRK